ncbi:ABC transporter ATP-binding protein [Pinisolibacter aquiterrae]|uniref:ABC transporter ATP-binding protein n=1 Tax=Pinisolibacter aquiterrae TaxID=2815579 RepID=UPI001C3C25F7|nr:ABC transporter ATP-binding protein [Pinisolibacter aquiterrae]MBV5265372.1 ABC transporter ATP-binding protein [Pinisolibacter aquiterrae]MCC8235250.1 ABC transporter ATP-binding protein [Pinisolibacter aquiterrae]
MLVVENLTKTFGGVTAVSDVSFTVEKGTTHAVIGPNGAGKTTLFNLITGVYTPTLGSIRLEGVEIGGIAPEKLARRGVSRTFQNLQVSMNLSALENVMTGAHLELNSSLVAAMVRWPGIAAKDRALRARAAELLDFVGCGRYAGADARSMPYGALKRLEIARALAADPKILFLDEPAAGLNHTETHEIEGLIAELGRRGITVVLVEHDMKLVMSVSTRIVVLDYGKKLAEGTPEEIRTNRDVIAAYLGAETEGA